ncbi:hypothetical protein BCR44DRAFT_42133 [Catenaria anguillulae PL171]|uniref:Uncharacterized protein n=1 Tax=Catenaria anguillulae PL171 TaxID=765915 RepID=A0A1Y2H5U2_9FUNG|nr:hypothetical protein BCR44DRAFT_42133 [Catenaria anguillulae PL171]
MSTSIPAALIGRNVGAIFDLVHAGLAGASIMAVVWMWTKRQVYTKASKGKLTILVMVLLVLRNIIAIRVETRDRASCAAIAFTRAFVANLLGPMITNYFLYELFVNIVVKPRFNSKKVQKRIRWAMHLSYQLGALGFLGYGLFFIPSGISPLGFCFASYPPANVTIIGSVWAFLATSFQAGLYAALLVSSKKLSTNQFTPLFKVTAVSGLLLALWQLYVQIDIFTQPQTEEWKPILNTITFTWRVVNTVLINNYLIGLREQTKAVARSSSSARASVSVSSTSSTMGISGAAKALMAAAGSVSRRASNVIAGTSTSTAGLQKTEPRS